LKEEQTITVIELLKHLAEPIFMYTVEFFSLLPGSNFCIQYEHFDVIVEESGNAYLLPMGCIKPVLIYDAYKSIFDISGVPIHPIESILKKVAGCV